MNVPRHSPAAATVQPDVAGVIAPPPLLYATGFVAGMLLDRALPRLPEATSRRWTVGAPLVAVGIGLIGWALRTMHHRGTPPMPTEPTTTLVTDGPFRFSRNPAYLGMTMAYTGLAMMSRRLGPLRRSRPSSR